MQERKWRKVTSRLTLLIYWWSWPNYSQSKLPLKLSDGNCSYSQFSQATNIPSSAKSININLTMNHVLYKSIFNDNIIVLCVDPKREKHL